MLDLPVPGTMRCKRKTTDLFFIKLFFQSLPQQCVHCCPLFWPNPIAQPTAHSPPDHPAPREATRSNAPDLLPSGNSQDKAAAPEEDGIG